LQQDCLQSRHSLLVIIYLCPLHCSCKKNATFNSCRKLSWLFSYFADDLQ
jgi:hypothetical protein